MLDRRSLLQKKSGSSDIETPNLIDLGLPSGILWADRNIGAAAPNEDGLYFFYGTPIGFTADQVIGLEYNDFNVDGNYNTVSTNIDFTGIPSWPLCVDPATALYGPGWRTPTMSDYKELDNVTTTLHVLNNEESLEVTGNGNTLWFYTNTTYNVQGSSPSASRLGVHMLTSSKVPFMGSDFVMVGYGMWSEQYGWTSGGNDQYYMCPIRAIYDPNLRPTAVFYDDTYPITKSILLLSYTVTYGASYTNVYCEFPLTLPAGTYELSVQGGNGDVVQNGKGRGGYADGFLTLDEPTMLWIDIGMNGKTSTDTTYILGGAPNGGAARTGNSSNTVGSGGGSTDIRVMNDNYEFDEYHRIIVAGGGGGSYAGNPGGAGGGATGSSGIRGNYLSNGGSQTEGGGASSGNYLKKGSFDLGGGYNYRYSGTLSSGTSIPGGGGGYYGGGSMNTVPGSGGSGFVYIQQNAYIDSKYLLTDTHMSNGDTYHPTPIGRYAYYNGISLDVNEFVGSVCITRIDD